MLILKTKESPTPRNINLANAGANRQTRRQPMRKKEYKLNDGSYVIDITGRDPVQWVVTGRYAHNDTAAAAVLALAESVANSAINCDIYNLADTWLNRSASINDINYTNTDYINGTPVVTEWRMTLAVDDIGGTQFTPTVTEMPGEMPMPESPAPQPVPPVNYISFLRLWSIDIAPTPDSAVTGANLEVSGTYHAAAGDGSTLPYFAFRVPDNIVGSWGLSALYSTGAGSPQQIYRSFGNTPQLDTSLDTQITRAVGLKLVTVQRGGFVGYVGNARSQAATDIAGKYIFITLRG